MNLAEAKWALPAESREEASVAGKVLLRRTWKGATQRSGSGIVTATVQKAA